MRILFVCGAGYVYGKELLTLTLMKELRERNHEVYCLHSSWTDGEFPKLLDQESLTHISAPLGFISKTPSWSAITMTLDQIRKLPSLWFQYRKLIRTFKPEIVVHTNFHHLVLLQPFLSRDRDVFHVHDCFPSSKFNRLFLKTLERRLGLFIGVSSFVAESLIKLGIPRAKVVHVLNGISGVGANSNIKSERNAEKSPLSIGIIGQIEQWKGHDVLVDALSVIKSHGIPFTCKIFGDGEAGYSAALRNKVSKLELTSEVEWKGFVGDRSSIYSLIDLCVIPSRAFETFGMVAAEASLHGIPVIATRRGALPEVVVDNETGYLVDAGSSEQLAEKIELLIRSDKLRTTMGAAARQHALLNLSSDRMVRQFETVLSSIH